MFMKNIFNAIKPEDSRVNFVTVAARNAVLTLFLLVGFFSISAQQNGFPLQKINGESNQMVNLYTGRMSVNLPLAGVAGRGDGSVGINVLTKNTEWQVMEADRYYHPTTGQLIYVTYAAAPSMPDYRQDYTPMSISFQTDKGGYGLVWDASGPVTSYPVLTTSDGNKINFRDTLREGEPTELGTGGVQCSVVYGIQWTPDSPPPPPPPAPPANCLRGRVFKSTDGSGMTFVTDADVYDAHNTDPLDTWARVHYFAHIDGSNGRNRNLNGYLYLPNGTKYRIRGGKPTVITDRNGNETKLDYIVPPFAGGLGINCNSDSDDLTVCRMSKITDSLKREVTITYGAYTEQGYMDTVSYKGFEGAERQVKIYYDQMSTAMYPGETIDYPIGIPTINYPQNSNLNKQDLSKQLDKYAKLPAEKSNITDYRYNPIVVSRVTLPNGQEYQFKYNKWGEIRRVKIPTGAYTDYDYGPLPNPRVCTSLIETKRSDPSGLTWTKVPWHPVELPDAIVRRVTESKVYDENGTLLNKSVYSDIGSERPVKVTIKDANNTTLQSSKHYFINDLCTDLARFFSATKYFDDWRENREIKTELYADENATTPLRITEVQWAQRATIPWMANHPFAEVAFASNDPRVTEVKTTLETGQVSKKTYSYDQFNNVTDVYEYDYGNGQAGGFLRRSHIDYLTDTNYTSHTGAHLRRLPIQSWMSSDLEGSNKVSFSQIEYDNYSQSQLVSRSNASGHNTANYDSSHTIRGNVTKVTSYADANSLTGAVSSKSEYDILGNIVKNIDAKGYVSTIEYGDRFGPPDAEARSNAAPAQLSGLSTFAFVTSATNPLGYKSYSQYDYYSGLVVDSEDVNENVSTKFYNDVLERPTQIITGNNRPNLRNQVTTVYDDVNRKTTVTSDLYAFGDNLTKSETLYDSTGRVTETRQYEAGGYIVTGKPQYDGLGRVVQSTNLYRPYLNEQPVWTTNTYDALGRIIKIKTPDNAEALTEYSGNITTITDQSGKKSRNIANAIAQIIRVDEPNAVNDLGDVSNPVQPTYYTYNTNGNLVRVSQGQQNRYFLYDALGRLIRLRQPEQNTNSVLNLTDPVTGNSQWSAGSTYDANGNPQTLTDANNIVITNTYDNLNRPMTRSYSDGTPTVNYQYDDVNVPFSKGQLTRVSSTVSETRNTSFDAMGRVLSSQQLTTPEQRNGTQAPWSMSYTYNLSGGLVEQTYPSGRIVKNTFDNNAKLTTVSGKTTGQADFYTYASKFVYTASGSVASMRLGNGRWESALFNSRLQVTHVALGSSPYASNLWKVNYEYGDLDGSGNPVAVTNNGNITRQTINFSGLNQTFVQTYKYDSLNRLYEAKELNGATQTWTQNLAYDRYGNRTSFNQQMLGAPTVSQTPVVDTINNRFTTGQGFVYDFNGNLVADNQGRQFTFNGDNKQIEVRQAGDTIGVYEYDGNGKRVKKISASDSTIFVYDAGGKLVAEYSSQTSANPTVSYLTSDNLGSPRVITDNAGVVISRRDFLPFGEDLHAGMANRTQALKYSVAGLDNVRKRFTGYEKDSETGLDFAEARMYNNLHGRFTAVDPLLASGLSANPQTFNRYVYLTNNPVNDTDSTGMWSDSQWTSYNPGFFSPSWDDGLSVRHPRPFIEYITTIRRHSPSSSTPASSTEPQNPDQVPDAPQQPDETPAQPQQTESLQDRIQRNFVERMRKQSLARMAERLPLILGGPPSPLGSAVEDSQTPLQNCMGLGVGERGWIQTSGSFSVGKGKIVDDQRIFRSFFTRTFISDKKYTFNQIPEFYGGTEMSSGATCDENSYQLRIFQDASPASNNGSNVHVMREQSPGSGLWMSKNGRGQLYVNITNPNLFYNTFYPPQGKVTITYYCMPKRLIE